MWTRISKVEICKSLLHCEKINHSWKFQMCRFLVKFGHSIYWWECTTSSTTSPPTTIHYRIPIACFPLHVTSWYMRAQIIQRCLITVLAKNTWVRHKQEGLWSGDMETCNMRKLKWKSGTREIGNEKWDVRNGKSEFGNEK